MSDQSRQDRLTEARKLLDASAFVSSNLLAEDMLAWARKLIEADVMEGDAEATWLSGELSTDYTGTPAEVEARHLDHLNASAAAGVIEAKFKLSLFLFDQGETSRAATLCQEAAEAGLPAAMWCHGLDLISGTARDRNEATGIDYIRRAAEQNVANAVKFMADTTALGQFGLTQDEAEGALWHRRLNSPQVYWI
ncbi:hypothetical protein [Litoreibacter roseus]|uniref:Sel1 repeat family protein n=1 Tax=Litoreibacter roseus TaxID=2601869 RepID=A0A6N6JFP6_9RHOB|nr:hypothetical protein [Litoreibacter roseus]GFE64108.1 hypothetical protein KIN_11820 [Litoreibacter roseus]